MKIQIERKGKKIAVAHKQKATEIEKYQKGRKKKATQWSLDCGKRFTGGKKNKKVQSMSEKAVKRIE